jgi:replicative DNA helicase
MAAKTVPGHITHMPCNEAAEQSVLGAMLIEPQAIEKASAMLTESDFYVDKHQTLFRVITEMYSDDVPTDAVTLPDRVARDRRATEFGGASYIIALFDAVPTAAHVENYCRIVRDNSLLRSLLLTGLEAMTRAQNPVEDAQSLLDTFQRKMYEIASRSTGCAFSPLSEALMSLHDEIEERAENPVDTLGIPTGFEEVDAILCGLQRGSYNILAGRPGMGKTACALKIGLNVARQGRSVALFSGEMPKRQLALRMVSEQAEVSGNQLLTGRAKRADVQRAVEVTSAMYSLPIRILDNPDTTVSGLASTCRQMKSEAGLDLLIVDYIGLLQTKKNWGTRREEVGEISRMLKKLAMDLDIPILVLSQLNRGVQGREDKRPVMSDLRETGDLEQDADTISFLYREAYYKREEVYLRNEDGTAAVENVEFLIEKNRNGPTGVARIGFVREWAKFCERPVMTGPTGY